MIPVKVCVSCHEMSGQKNIITRPPGYFTYSGGSSSRLSDLLYFTCLSSHESHSPVITWHTVCWSVSLCGRQSCYWSRFCRESWVQVNFLRLIIPITTVQVLALGACFWRLLFAEIVCLYCSVQSGPMRWSWMVIKLYQNVPLQHFNPWKTIPDVCLCLWKWLED